MAVISTPPIWQQNRAYSARLDRQFADVFFGEGVIDVASGDFEVTQTSPLTNSVLVNTGRAVIQGDDESNQGKYLILSESILNVPLNAAPPADARIDLVCLRVNDPVAGGPPGDDAEVTFVEGVAAPAPVAPSLPTTAIPLASILRTAGDTSITNAMITDLRAQALIVPGTALTANGDLLTRNAGSAVAIPVGSAGLPLLAGSPIPGYAQINTGGIADGAVTAAKMDASALKVRQHVYDTSGSTYSVSGAASVTATDLTLSITPTAANSVLVIHFNAQVNITVLPGGLTSDKRSAFIYVEASGFSTFMEGGRFLVATSTTLATSIVPFTITRPWAPGNTTTRTFTVRLVGTSDATSFLNSGAYLSVTEYAP